MDNQNILVLAPGLSIIDEKEKIDDFITNNKPVIISVNFNPDNYKTDFIFSSNIRRYAKLENETAKKIITSNVKDVESFDYKLNFT